MALEEEGKPLKLCHKSPVMSDIRPKVMVYGMKAAERSNRSSSADPPLWIQRSSMRAKNYVLVPKPSLNSDRNGLSGDVKLGSYKADP